MSQNNKNNKRAPNFSTAEINFLLCEVEKFKNILECKKTDRIRTEEKAEIWRKIEGTFNAKYGQTFRSHAVLKTKYENLKKTAKIRFAADKSEQYRTGGGPLPAATVTDVDCKISQICQPEQMFGTDAVYDDDVIEFLENDELGSQDHQSDDNASFIKTERVENSPWSKYTPTSLKTPVHTALRNKKEKTKDVWAKVGEAKLKKIDMEMDCLRKQTELYELTETKLKLDIKKTKMEIEIMQKKLNAL